MDSELQQFRQADVNLVSAFPRDPVVAMAYIPYQNPKAVYTASCGLKKGTMFPCLNKPFLGGRRNRP